MRKATLIRTEMSDAGTFGQLTTDSGFSCMTGELPWRGNEPNKSCIPEGVYLCVWQDSPKHGPCYHLQGVPGRTAVEIHAANFMGDADKGYKCELAGCIAPGSAVGELEGQEAVLASRSALEALENDMNHEPFELTIMSSSLPPYDFG